MLKGLVDLQITLGRLLNPNAYDNLLNQIGQVVYHAIQSKTARGVDYLNQGFTPYNEVYKRWKVSKGHSGRVNLWLTGQMLDSLAQKREGKTLTINFDNTKANDKAVYNEQGRVPRLFMGISPEIEKQIDEMVIQCIDNLLGI